MRSFLGSDEALILIFGVFYFLIIRPQMAKQKQKALQRKRKLLGFKEWLARSYQTAIKPITSPIKPNQS